jgi:hypothetical protein
MTEGKPKDQNDARWGGKFLPRFDTDDTTTERELDRISTTRSMIWMIVDHYDKCRINGIA